MQHRHVDTGQARHQIAPTGQLRLTGLALAKEHGHQLTIVVKGFDRGHHAVGRGLLHRPHGRDAVGASAGFGALIFFGVPLVGVILLFTIVAIPLGVGLLLITLPLHALGYVIAMFILGRLIIKQPSSIWLAFLVGWILLSIVSLIPFAGSLIGFIASFYGLGAIFVAAWRVRKDGVATADQPPAALPTS